MTWTAPAVERTQPPTISDERTSLQSWLDYHRMTLLSKCEGLTGEQLVLRPSAPSSLSLLGLVRHMAEVERWWFRRAFASNAELGDIYCTEEFPDGDFDLTDAAQAEADFATFDREVILADEAAADALLDDTFTHPTRQTLFDLRWVYTHMIEEYARHNGHADIMREQLDGRTGV